MPAWPVSNGRLARADPRAVASSFVRVRAANATGESGASVPPTRHPSTVPDSMRDAPWAIACRLEGQPLEKVHCGPCAPTIAATSTPGPWFGAPVATNGLTRRAPRSRRIAACCSPSATRRARCRPSRRTRRRRWRIGAVARRDIASSAATMASCDARVVVRRFRGSTCSASASSSTSPDTRHGVSAGSNRRRRPIAERPARTSSQNRACPTPVGPMRPIPVITARRATIGSGYRRRWLATRSFMTSDVPPPRLRTRTSR